MRVFRSITNSLTHSYFCIQEIASPNRDLLAMEEKQLMYCLKSLKENTYFCARIFEAERPRNTGDI